MNAFVALLLCLLSSALLWFSFFPFNIGWLGWIALAPLAIVLEQYVKNEDKSRRWFDIDLHSAWLAGLLFCLLAFRWISLASTPMYAVYFTVAMIISLQWFFFFQFTRLLTKTLKLPLMLSAAISWTALEYLRAEIWIGYAWYYLGHTQHEEVYFTQAADLVGVYGLSFIMVMVNVALARLIKERSLKVVSYELVPSVILVGLACWYGSTVIIADAQELHRPQSPRLAILQGSQPQDLRNDRDMWQKIDKTYAILGDEAARFNPELIIAPETCISVTWFRLPNGQLPPWAAAKFPELNLAAMANYHRSWADFVPPRWKTYLLFGFNTFDFRGEEMRHTNSALLINPNGDLVDVYDKIVCLPFGEYIPWADTLPFMKLLSPYPYEYTVQPGTTIHALRWKDYRLGALICYEDTVPGLARSFVLQENPSFFVNISNDGWFKGSEEHEQHLVCARFRCIENRRAMVRSVNMGISCIIDGLGRVIALPSPAGGKGVPGVFTASAPGSTWHEVKGQEGLIVGTVPLYTQISLYTKLGDVLPWICWGMMTLAWIVSVVRARKPELPSRSAS